MNLAARIVLGLAISFETFAAPRFLVSSLHSKRMSVEYRILDSGERVLVARERVEQPSTGKAIWQDVQTVEIGLKKGEHLSEAWSFRCFTRGRQYAYSVVTAEVARKTEVFRPLRAWAVDEKAIRLVPVDDPKTVMCLWNQEGETPYPFKKD